MHRFATYVLCLWLVFLPACQVPPEVSLALGRTLDTAITVLDKNQDRIVTKEEAKGLDAEDPMLWIQILTGLGLFGGYRALRKSTDELYDRTHKPAIPQ